MSISSEMGKKFKQKSIQKKEFSEVTKHLILKEHRKPNEMTMGIRAQFEEYFDSCTKGKEITDELIDEIVKVFAKMHKAYNDEKGIEAIKTWVDVILHPEKKKPSKGNTFRISPVNIKNIKKKDDDGRV